MNKIKRFMNLDNMGLIIIGAGVSLFYYYFETTILASETLAIIITAGIILLISLCTQLLVNNINRSKEALREANETLEIKVRERTAELRESEMKYRTIFENTGTATVIVEEDTTISLANSEFANMAGYEKSEIENLKSWLHFVDEKTQRKIQNSEVIPNHTEYNPTKPHFECTFIDKEGTHKDMLCSLADIPGSESSVVSLADITELKEAERQIYHQAFHDALTSLPNRALFMEHLNMALKRAKRRDDYYFAVLYLDIDRFKLVNDSLGHSVGDQLIRAFASRIQESLRDLDILARFGGDEFVILLEDIENSEFASGVANRLQQELKRPFIIENKEVFAPASFGVVLNTRDYGDPENIIRDADAAMYHAKENGKAQYKIFDKTLHKKALHLLERETDLRKAVNRDEFENHYQPIVDLQTASLVGFEALIRWNHPQLGLINPGSFISIAEETGLIIPITQLIAQQACEDLCRWQKRLQDELKLSMNINLSSKHFMSPTLLDDIQEILKQTGMPPEQLKLEITETALMEDADETIRLVHRLKDLGLKLVIDDFGTGYSSLASLKYLPIDCLKVDRLFITDMLKDADSSVIMGTIVSVAHALGHSVIAEGVETHEQLKVLSGIDCDMVQGYFFSRPVPATQIPALANTIFLPDTATPTNPAGIKVATES